MKITKPNKFNFWTVWSEKSREVVFYSTRASDCVGVARMIGGRQYSRAGFKVQRFDCVVSDR